MHSDITVKPISTPYIVPPYRTPSEKLPGDVGFGRDPLNAQRGLAGRIGEQHGTRGNAPGSCYCYTDLSLRRIPSGEADGLELSVLHLLQVAGHIQQNTYQVEHPFH